MMPNAVQEHSGLVTLHGQRRHPRFELFARIVRVQRVARLTDHGHVSKIQKLAALVKIHAGCGRLVDVREDAVEVDLSSSRPAAR